MSALSMPMSLFSRQHALLVLVAFLVSRAALVPGSAACGFAFFTSVLAGDRSRAPLVAFWVFLGLVTALPLALAFQYGVLMVTLFLLSRQIGEECKPWLRPSYLAFLLVVVGRALPQVVAGGLDHRFLLLVLLEGLLVMVLSMIFGYGLPIITRRGNLQGLDNEESVCLVILGALLMLGVGGVAVGSFSLRQISGKYLIMILALAGGGGMGASLGTAYGVVGILMGSLPLSAPGAYAFTGLIAGAFRSLGKVGVGLGFIATDFLLGLYLFQSPNPGMLLGESLFALGLLLLTPSRYLSEVARILPGTLENRRFRDEYDQRVRQVAVGRLTEVSQVFSELADTLEEITATEQSREEERLNHIFRELCQQVCEHCNLYQNCWEEDFYKTYRLIFDLLGLAEVQGGLDKYQLPGEVRRRCIRIQDLVTAINHLLEIYRLNHYWQQRLVDKGSMVSTQMRGVAGIVADLARELKVDVDYQEGLTNALNQHLAGEGIEVLRLNALSKPGGQLEINLTKNRCPANAQCSRIVRPAVEKVCGRRLRLEQRQCALRTRGDTCILRLVPDRLFGVVTGAVRRAKSGSTVSGDNYSVEELGDGRIALILSDGMGVGPPAAEESITTIALLERLLNAGFDEELSLRTVNSILMLRMGEDKFATVDLAILDLYAGEAEFLKVGSASSFIKRGRNVSMIQTPSLPIGIVEEIKVEPVKRRLRDGDIIVMVTDGVAGDKEETDGNNSWLVEQLQETGTDDPGELAKEILEGASRRFQRRRDDMAVLVARVEREN